MKPTAQKKSILNVSLTPKEFSVLQATAMGFGAAAIQELWDLSDDDYRITCSSLFAKMGVKDLDEDLSKESKSFLMRHVYRVQKLSTKFYEFRLAYNNQLGNNDFPNYIRINNFGKRKTGWFSYHPQKIEVSLSGQIRRAAIPTLSTQKPQTSMS